MAENDTTKDIEKGTLDEDHVKSSEQDMTQGDNPEDSRTEQPLLAAADQNPTESHQESVHVATGAMLAVLLCSVVLLTLSSRSFLTDHANLPLAIQDAQAFLACHAANGTCQRPKFDSLGSTASGGIVWRAVSYAVILPTVSSVVAFWKAFSEYDENPIGTLILLNVLTVFLGASSVVACLFEPDSSDQCHGDVCRSMALFTMGIATFAFFLDAVIAAWYWDGSQALWRQVQATGEILSCTRGNGGKAGSEGR